MNQIQKNDAIQKKPFYKDAYRGVGINAHEYEAIIKVSTELYQSGNISKSQTFAEKLKQILGNEWFVFANSSEDETCDFYISNAKSIDFASFIIENTKIIIYRIRLS